MNDLKQALSADDAALDDYLTLVGPKQFRAEVKELSQPSITLRDQFATAAMIAPDRVTELEIENSRLYAENRRLREAMERAFYLPTSHPHLDGSEWYDEAQVILGRALSNGGER
jgi:G3E family GTPase